jgi:hypothetical protein
MAAPGHRVQHEDISVQSMRETAVRRAYLARPVVVVRRAQLVRKPVGERPSDAVDEERRVFLQCGRLAVLPRQVGVALEELLGVDEGDLLRKLGVAAGL